MINHMIKALLWDLYGARVNQIYNSWNTCAKLTWGVPRATHTFLVDNLLVNQFFTVKQQLVGRYVNFVKQLLNSSSPEVCVVANIVGRCARSTTGRNLLNIERETQLDPWTSESWMVRSAVPRSEVPAMQGWRVQYLGKLLDARLEMEAKCEDTEEITTLIDDLCRS